MKMEKQVNELIDKLAETQSLTKDEIIILINAINPQLSEYLFAKARNVREKHYGKDVYIRGLIEFTNYCKNDCFYCGIRKSNKNTCRYRLTPEEIMECCHTGYDLGFRTFVLQGGEDPEYSDMKIIELIWAIKKDFPDCALTLSVGERMYEAYAAFLGAGADRYLLRHETANPTHYRRLHPPKMSCKERKKNLYNLKKLGFQTGAGFMVGSPWQTPEFIADDLLFLKDLQPEMVGIGPFLPHHDTPFAKMEKGSLKLTLFLLGMLRLLLPKVLLPATTALGTIASDGRERGLLAGANVVMPNLSPKNVREKYLLYDNKIHTDEEAAESKEMLEAKVKSIGYNIVTSRGDAKR